MITEPDVTEVLLDALTFGRTEVVVSDLDADNYMAAKLIDKLRRHRATNDEWRFYMRSDGGQTKVIVMSPRCKDPAPPTHANAKRRQAARAEQKKPAEKSLLAEWVLDNLISDAMKNISVVPYQDIKTLKGVSNYEAYMTDKVSKALHRNDVRVMVREVHYHGCLVPKAYNATLIFL